MGLVIATYLWRCAGRLGGPRRWLRAGGVWGVWYRWEGDEGGERVRLGRALVRMIPCGP